MMRHQSPMTAHQAKAMNLRHKCHIRVQVENCHVNVSTEREGRPSLNNLPCLFMLQYVHKRVTWARHNHETGQGAQCNFQRKKEEGKT